MNEHPILQRWDRPVSLLLLGVPAIVILAATFVSNGATRIYSWPWAFYVQAALLAPWLWCAWSVARGRPGSRTGWWIVLPAQGALVTSILASAHPRAALEASLVLITPLLLVPFAIQYWLQADSKARFTALRVLGLALTGFAAVSLASWLARAPANGAVEWFFSQRNPHPLGHWNLTGGVALLALPVTLYLSIRDQGLWRALGILGSTLATLQLLSAGSRGTVLGLIIGGCVGLAAVALRRRFTVRHATVTAAALLLVGLLAIGSNARLRRIITDPASVLAVGESEQQRIGFLLTGVRIAQSHPITGIGPGTTPYHYPHFRVDLPGSLENSFQLHCGPLQWWVDTGLIGVASLAWAAIWIGRRLWRSRRELSDPAIMSVSALGAYATLWGTDYQLDVPILPLMVAFYGAFLVAETNPPDPIERSLGRLWPVVLFCFALVTVVVMPSWRSRACYAAAWHAKDTHDAIGFVQGLKQAADDAPWNPYLRNHLARALAGTADYMPPESATALRVSAREAWIASLDASPDQDHPWINLGWLALISGDHVTAVENLSRATAIYPRRAGVWFAMALAQIGLNRTEEAARSLAREIRLNPAFITSPLWRDEPFAAVRFQTLDLLASGWKAKDKDHGAGAAPSHAAFAEWWWLETTAPRVVDPNPLTLRFLAAREYLDRRDVEVPPVDLAPALHALREHWRVGTPLPETLVPTELAKAWSDHVHEHQSQAFTSLLRSFPGTAMHRIVRSADGILFRQIDGDPLSDLAILPVSSLAGLMGPVLPVPAVDDFFNKQAIRPAASAPDHAK